MDLLTLVGLAIGLGAVGWVLASGGIAGIFYDPNAFVLVFGGTIGATLITFPWKVVRHVPGAIRRVFFPPRRRTPDALIAKLMEIRQTASTGGIDAVDLDEVDDEFLRIGLRLLLEEHEEEDLKEELDTEIHFTRQRHQRLIEVFRAMGSYAPIFGLLGTLIGVVQVLKHLDDPSAMGQYMALAITTTFYGIFGSNFLFLPTAGKLENLSEDELILKELSLVGILSVKRDELPTMMRRRLERFVQQKTKEGAK